MCGRGIGDSLLTLPATSCLKNSYPDAKMTALTSPLSAQFLYESGYIDKVFCFDTKHSQKKMKEFLSLNNMLISKKFDLCISFGNRFFYRFFTFIANAQYKVGRHHKKNNLLYDITDHVIFPKNTIHEIERNLRLISMIGNVKEFTLPFVKIWENERGWAEEFVNEVFPKNNKKIICVHIGGSASYKLWPVEKYYALIQKLSSLFDVEVLVVYGPGDANLANEFDQYNNGHFHKYCPQSMGQLKALLGRADLVICNDSGPMHIADALNVPLVAIFGGTDYKRWEPISSKSSVIRQSMDCWPCDAYYCKKDSECIKELPVETVWNAVSCLMTNQGWE